MPAGRPAHYKNANALQKRIDEFFEVEDVPTWAGLAYFLGFADRRSLNDYEAREEFSHTIKNARTRIEADKVKRALKGEYNTAMAIFDLTNNHGYQNSRNVDHTSKGKELQGLSIEIVDASGTSTDN